jgi:hypothetical protein
VPLLPGPVPPSVVARTDIQRQSLQSCSCLSTIAHTRAAVRVRGAGQVGMRVRSGRELRMSCLPRPLQRTLVPRAPKSRLPLVLEIVDRTDPFAYWGRRQ